MVHTVVSVCASLTQSTQTGVDCKDDPDFILMIYESVSPGCVVLAAGALHAFYYTFPPAPKFTSAIKEKYTLQYDVTRFIEIHLLCINRFYVLHHYFQFIYSATF